MLNDLYITVSSGMRGYYAVKRDANSEEEGPIATGITCATFEGAVEEAKRWAKADGIRYK